MKCLQWYNSVLLSVRPICFLSSRSLKIGHFYQFRSQGLNNSYTITKKDFF